MVIHTDDTGWGLFATAFGFVVVAEYAAQFATTMFTLAVSITVAHFLKRYLHRRYPIEQQKRRRARKPAASETA